ncbi:hypothetical protein HK096_010555 [Nowakowskiella sp. JEL0078]|nr:hypothetical protein HK096_010555 [Nowakowskiella sp. JEL0078]
MPQILTIHKDGFRKFFNEVSWNALRIHLPGCAGLIATIDKQERWVANYYSPLTEQFTKVQLMKSLMTDLFLIINTGLTLNKTCTILMDTSKKVDLSGLNSIYYSYTSLSTAVVGLCIIAAVQMKLTPTFAYLFAFIVVSIVGAGLAILLYAFDLHNTGIYIISSIVFGFMTLSAIFALFLYQILPIVLILISFQRSGSLIVSPVSPYAFFPYCQLRTWAFAGPMLLFTILGIVMCGSGLIMGFRRIVAFDKKSAIQEGNAENVTMNNLS